MTKRALITGITGQDGAYLARLLLGHGYEVAGIYRRVSTPNFWRLLSLCIKNDVILYQADLYDATSLLSVIKDFAPGEVYHLAAQSFVDASFKEPLATGMVTGLATATLLEVIRQVDPSIKFYNAATSELYGNSLKHSANEMTPFAPDSPYAVAKLYALHMVRVYRSAYDMFACNGILFNHESKLRGLEFVTRKVTNAAARIKLGLQDKVQLGNLDSARDWGFSPDYVDAMRLMLQQDNPTDYVISTGETHTIHELCDTAFSVFGLDYRNYVETNNKYMRPLDVMYLRGNSTKAKNELGWEPKTKFRDLIELMTKADYDRWQQQLSGKIVHWDAPNHE